MSDVESNDIEVLSGDQKPNLVISYCSPFVFFIVLTAISVEVPDWSLFLYPIKSLGTSFLIWKYRKDYQLTGAWDVMKASIVGVVVLAVWVLGEGFYPLISETSVNNPYTALSQYEAYLWIAVRLVGAALIVPIMEEVFWRGFLIRWLINNDFAKVALGKITPFSFIATSVMFGFEHQRWLVGIFAGLAYNWLYWNSKSIKCCILSHAITNLLLGVYVLQTEEWQFW
ncbi:MAG: CAAX prenyl protease-related protein [Lentisphaeraceae bacterium]|nr:CAAX prenyl protease-related protein [Lentisphaeraceae bacterium]